MNLRLRVITPGLWRWKDHEPRNAVEIIHCAYVRWMLRDRQWRRMLWLRLFTAWWVVAGAALSLTMTARLGMTIKRRTGKALWRQYAEQQSVLWKHGILAPWYYIFELFDDAQRARAGEFIHRFETKQAIFTLLKRRFADRPLLSLTNKLRYFEQCKKFAIPTPPILAIAKEGQLIMQDGLNRLPEEDLFVKPLAGRGGRAANCWLYRDGDYHSPERNETLSADAVMQRLIELSANEAFIVQPRLKTCQALNDLTLGALVTVRVLSVRNERGDVEVTNACFRMPRADSPVDNFHAGGIGAHVDIATGKLAKATDLGIRRGTQWFTHHPATGAKIEGRVLPFWQDVIDLTRRAHNEAFRDRLLVGWDVGLTDEGPFLVEGNSSPDVDIIQRLSRQPLGSCRFGEALAYMLTLPAGDPRFYNILMGKEEI